MKLPTPPRALESLIRRSLHFYWRFARGLTLGVRAVVIDNQGRVFLVKHTYVSGWHLPGGGVEPGETLIEALARELQEEGNIKLTKTPELYGMYFNPRDSRRDHVALFVVESFKQPTLPRRNYEITEHGFFSPTKLPADATPATRARVAEVLNGVEIANRW